MAQFRKAYTVQGFDYEAVPRWQMIPMTESRYIVLRDGAGLVVTSLSPAVATVTEIATRELPRGPFSEDASDRFFRLDAVAWGFTLIQTRTAAGMPFWRSTQRT
jgi:hypothetical protein